MASCSTVYQVPGQKGATGAAGADGTDGVNAFTTVAAQFTVPSGESLTPTVSHESDGTDATVIMGAAHNLATGMIVDLSSFTDANFDATDVAVTVVDATTFTYPTTAPAGGVVADITGVVSNIRVPVTLTEGSWVAIGQFLQVESIGTFEVTDVSGNVATLLNPYDGTAGSYPNNATPGTVAAVGLVVAPAGAQGPQGTAGGSGAPATGTYITQVPFAPPASEQPLSALATGYMKSTTGTGVVSTQAVPIPIADGGTAGTTATAAFNALSPVTTRGDIIVRGAANNQRLAVGAANRVLRSDGTDPLWGQVVLTTDVTGILPVANGGTGTSSASTAGAYNFRARVSTTIAVAGVGVVVVFDTEEFDSNGAYDNATGIYTAAVTGVYQFNVKIQSSTNAGTFSIQVNGTSKYLVGTLLTDYSGSVLLSLTATDTVKIYSSGLSDVYGTTGGVSRSEFSGYLVK